MINICAHIWITYTWCHISIDIDECDPDPCVNGACVPNVGLATYTCICDQGFTGQNCETSKHYMSYFVSIVLKYFMGYTCIYTAEST